MNINSSNLLRNYCVDIIDETILIQNNVLINWCGDLKNSLTRRYFIILFFLYRMFHYRDIRIAIGIFIQQKLFHNHYNDTSLKLDIGFLMNFFIEANTVCLKYFNGFVGFNCTFSLKINWYHNCTFELKKDGSVMEWTQKGSKASYRFWNGCLIIKIYSPSPSFTPQIK